MAILEYIKNRRPYGLYADSSPEDGLSNHGNGIAEQILNERSGRDFQF